MFGLSLRAALLALSALSLFIAILLGGVALKSLDVVNGGAHALHDEILPRIAAANAMNAAFANLRIGEAEHVSSTDVAAKQAALQAIDRSKEKLRAALDGYRRSTPADDDAQRRIVEQVDAAIARYLTLDATFLDHSSSYREIDAGALFIGDMRRAHLAIGARLEELVALSERDADATDALNDAAYTRSWAQVLALVLCALAVSAAGAAFAFFGVSRPLHELRNVMSRIADGDLDAEAPFARRTDEIGSMAAAVEVFREGLARARELETERREASAGLDAQRRAATHDVARRFESAIGGVIAAVTAASTELQSTAQAMNGAATRTSSRSAHVASAAEEAASNVATIAAATERMGATVKEIGAQVSQSAVVAQSTVHDAERAAELVKALAAAAATIENVVEMISGIAGQTNLLALNATIEAARAGESGRGFAVVANEVKTLASQTAAATDEITRRIADVQTTTRDVVEAIEAIGARVHDMSAASGAIAAAVALQEAATQEIVTRVASANTGTSAVTANIADVAGAADETGAAAANVLVAASELSRQSVHLGEEVERFLSTVRAA